MLLGSMCVSCRRPGDALCAGCSRSLRTAPAGPPPLGLVDLRALWAYDDVARALLTSLKNGQRRDVLGFVVDQLASGGAPAGAGSVVTWAPTLASRRRSRGFDQAELLARAVARRWDLPCRGFLRRVKGPAQSGLGRRDRQAHAGFVVVGGVPPEVVVVDDVATTGATLVAAGRALRRAGALSVHGVVVARAGGPAQE